MEYYTLLLIVFVAAICLEITDTALGMMYGTILSPLLISLALDPKLIIPSILISQAVGGIIGTVRHHNYASANFNGLTRDTKVVSAIVIPDVLACILGAFIGTAIPPRALKLYIGLLVIVMGFLCLRTYTYRFTWKKICFVGAVSAFNKALSGGGFGPVTSTGKILGGLNPKVSIATTTYAEVPICIVAFISWVILLGGIEFTFPFVLCIGSALGALIGPWITYKIETDKLRNIVGVLAVLVGFWCVKTVFLQ